MPRRGPAARTVTAAAALVVATVALLAAPGPLGAAPVQEPGVETTENPAAPDRDIIPRPNSGSEPSDTGDRGGALQLAVLAAIVLGVGVIAWLAVRESRRNRRGVPSAGARAP